MQALHTTRLALATGTLDLSLGLLRHAQGERRLTGNELRLLLALHQAGGRTVSRQELLVEVWGHHPDSLSRAPDDTVRRLRTKIEPDPAQPVHLMTSHGEGYRFVPLADPGAAPPTAAPAPAAEPGVQLGDRRIELERQRIVLPDGSHVALSAQELALLRLLIDVQGAVIHRDDLHREVWGLRSRTGGRALDNAVRRLREKLEPDPAQPRFLLTLRGRGLRLNREPTGSQVATLPAAATSFVGRGETLRQLEELLQSGALVTLTGTGGLGKTRAALELARRWQDRPDAGPAVFCALESTRSLERLLARVAASLGAPEGARSAEALGRLLAARPGTLLVLDNVEQVLDAARAALQPWLRLPQLTVLVTSREPLRLGGERVVALAPLELEEARALFVARSAREWEGADAQAIPPLVERVDRIPLAIELAAARTAVLSPAQILARLDRQPGVLGRGPVDAPARHASLEAAVRWSWELLNPDQQRNLAWCGVFSGGFTLDAWEGLAPDGPDTALERLTELCAHSLVVVDAGRAPRFRLFESIRRFALDQLVARGELEAATEQHAGWFLAEGEALAEQVRSLGSVPATRRLAEEVDNLLAAADASVQSTPVRAGRLLRCVAKHLRHAGQAELLRARLDRVLDTIPVNERRLRGALERERLRLGIFEPSAALEPHLVQLLETARAEHDQSLELEVLELLGIRALAEGRPARAQEHFCAMATRAEAGGDRVFGAVAHQSLGVTARRRGAPAAARTHYEEALKLLGPEHHCRFRGLTHMNLGVLELREGRLQAAEHHLRRAVELVERVGAHGARTAAAANLGYALWMTGDALRGEALMRGALPELQRSLPAHDAAVLTGMLGRMLLVSGRPEAAVAALRAAVLGQRPGADRRQCQAFLAAGLVQLGHTVEAAALCAELELAGSDSAEVQPLLAMLGLVPTPAVLDPAAVPPLARLQAEQVRKATTLT